MLARATVLLILLAGGCDNDVSVQVTALDDNLPLTGFAIPRCTAGALPDLLPGRALPGIDLGDLAARLSPPHFPSAFLDELTVGQGCTSGGPWAQVAAPLVTATVDLEDAYTASEGEQVLRLGIQRVLVEGLQPVLLPDDACAALSPLRVPAGACLPSDLDVRDLRLLLRRTRVTDAWRIQCADYALTGALTVRHDCARCADPTVCAALATWESAAVFAWSPPYLLALLRALEGALNAPLR